MTFQVIVCLAEGRNITIDLGSKKHTTVLQLKEKIAKKLPGDRDQMVKEMKLIFADKRLEKDHKRLSDYGIEHQSVIRIVISLDGGLTRMHTQNISTSSS